MINSMSAARERNSSIHRLFLAIFVLAWLPPADWVAEAGGANPPGEPVATNGSTLQRITRLNPQLPADNPTGLPMKVRSLLEGEFEFYRGTSDLFYDWCREHCSDWAADPGAFVRLHGDIHIGNIGTLRVNRAATTAVEFGVVDFDDTINGPFQLDLLRGAVSLRFAARDQKQPLDDESWRRVVAALCDAYGDALSGKVDSDRLKGEHKEISKLLNEASGDKPSKHAKKYLIKKKGGRFAPARFKKKKLSDIMLPVDANTRSKVIGALWNARDPRDERLVTRIGITGQAQLESAVQDVVRWTRIGSAGSQGLDKYLVLLDRQTVGENGPFIIELKEEPAPAAVRAGYLKSADGGLARAREVAEGHQQLWPELPWCVGYSAIGDKGFLVRSKGPWAEELNEDDFEGVDGALRAGRIIGSAVGLAHRAALSASNKGNPDTKHMLAKLEALPAEIESRGREVDRVIQAAYENLKHDSRARELAEKADAFIASSTRAAQ